MTGPRIMSLFSGYGGLDQGVRAVIGGDVVAHVEFDAAPSAVLAHHWPNVPNLGDVTEVNWSEWAGKVDVMTGGFPCQDVSLAGLRRGLQDGTRSGLWSEFARGIDQVRPGLVVIENVRGLLSATADRQMESSPWSVGDRHDGPALRALGAVLGDLADLGYDARWCGLRAADAGAPHGRYRIFVVAYPRDAAHLLSEWGGGLGEHPARDSWAPRGAGRPAPQDADVAARSERGIAASREAEGGRARSDAGGRGGTPAPRDVRGRFVKRTPRSDWGVYAAAVERWERVTGRLAPPATELSRQGQQRLSPAFVEWMMGLDAGHVTSAPINRNAQLKALGNGVVPQQAALAVRTLLTSW